jgi:ribosomal protein L37AE/L43A
VLALVSVGLGLGQLGFFRWLENQVPHGTAVAIEGGVFLIYAGLVILLLWRLQHHKRAGAPRCPQCGRPLLGVSERIAAATGRCDACGGQVVA